VLELWSWFFECLEGLASGAITEVPEETGLAPDVISALHAAVDLDAEWKWQNTPLNRRGDGPVLSAMQELARQCRAVEAGRKLRARKRHCINGHEYTAENTRTEIRRGGVVVRHCRACARERHRRDYAAAKARAESQI
jgi:hypothetical protein